MGSVPSAVQIQETLVREVLRKLRLVRDRPALAGPCPGVRSPLRRTAQAIEADSKDDREIICQEVGARPSSSNSSLSQLGRDGAAARLQVFADVTGEARRPCQGWVPHRLHSRALAGGSL